MALSSRRSIVATGLAVLSAALLPGFVQLSAVAGEGTSANPDLDVVRTLGDPVAGLGELDLRGRVAPTTAQRRAAASLGTLDLRWNRFGTPASVLPADGSLGPAGSSDPVVAARDWLRDHADAFAMTAEQVDDLELVGAQKFADSPARAVLFRQRFGDLSPALGSMVTVGVAHGEIAYVSSSLTRTTGAPAAARLSPTEAWLTAARDVGRDVSSADLSGTTTDRVPDAVGRVAGGPVATPVAWTRFHATDFAQEQQVRLRALALADGTVRPVYETNVVDVDKGVALAYTLMVDAVTGDVLHRHNQVDSSSSLTPFQGELTATGCGEPHPFELTDDQTRQVAVVATAANAANDIVIKLYAPGGDLLASGDLGTSPETLTYQPPGGGTLAQGIYTVKICPFDDPTVPLTAPYNYGGTVATSDEGGAAPEAPQPRWAMFPSNPTLNWSPDHTPSNAEIACQVDEPGCTLSTGPVQTPWGGAWDYLQRIGAPTLTTSGNNAQTREAWASPLTPGGTEQAPVSPTREYTAEFQDIWNNSRCDPSQIRPGGNDIDPVVTNLFVSHNRMHDYSYGLGFTELNYNLQDDNLGRNPDPTRQNDPEVGNAQAGALTGGQPTFLGRDNANQITLQDGTPGITNQYLFQPIAGAFYSPCADGALDMSIVGHEYTHAISNRMIGGPDEGISSEQGGAMGESWGDLIGAEYMFSHRYRTGANPWAVGPYATGNKQRGIRDYAINRNPLNYSDYGFDSTGNEVHADGEIWNGTQWEVRQALVDRWDAQYPYANDRLQKACAEERRLNGPRRAVDCPGNRRWVQMMFDAFLLQQGATSMLDARDAMLAADRMRYDGPQRNQKALWDAFARRGMGAGASTPSPDSGNTAPSFASPYSDNARITFRTRGGAEIFVGDYEARATPVADTRRGSDLDATAAFTPGRYRMLSVSRTRGFTRFVLRVTPGGDRTVTVRGGRNLAAEAAGARVLTASAGSLNARNLIDGTEGTSWGGVNGDGTNVDEQSPFVAVDLAGSVHRIHRVNVSAMLNPAPASSEPVPLAADPDTGSRFTALRRFALEACVAACGSDGARWKRFYTSPADAFPSTLPRPVAPTLTLRSFDVPDVRAAAVRLVALENQCTGYAGYAGEQDDDPTNDTDCRTASDRGSIVHAAELQVF
jgi:extracellular elastinolytic metalloproteinase